MKAFTKLVSVAALVVSVSLPVFAAPASECTAGTECSNNLAEDAVDLIDYALGDILESQEVAIQKTAQDFITWMDAHPAEVNKKSLCFYSGGTQLAGQATVTPVHTVLGRFSQRPDVGCNILQDILKLVPASFNDQGNWGNDEWTEVSRAAARLTAKDPVFVLLGTTVKKDSVWELAEKPELQKHLKSKALKDVQIWSYTAQDTFVKGQNLTP